MIWGMTPCGRGIEGAERAQHPVTGSWGIGKPDGPPPFRVLQSVVTLPIRLAHQPIRAGTEHAHARGIDDANAVSREE